MSQSFVCVYCHLVFGTKDRAPIIDDEMRPRLHAYLGAILKGNQCPPVCIGGTADHLHALFCLGKQIAPCDAVRAAKSGSSHWVHETFPEAKAFAWQGGYSMYPVSARGLERAKAYILNQAEHHRTVSFEEEYLSFLRAHGLPYDERYLWG